MYPGVQSDSRLGGRSRPPKPPRVQPIYANDENEMVERGALAFESRGSSKRRSLSLARRLALGLHRPSPVLRRQRQRRANPAQQSRRWLGQCGWRRWRLRRLRRRWRRWRRRRWRGRQHLLRRRPMPLRHPMVLVVKEAASRRLVKVLPPVRRERRHYMPEDAAAIVIAPWR